MKTWVASLSIFCSIVRGTIYFESNPQSPTYSKTLQKKTNVFDWEISPFSMQELKNLSNNFRLDVLDKRRGNEMKTLLNSKITILTITTEVEDFLTIPTAVSLLLSIQQNEAQESLLVENVSCYTDPSIKRYLRQYSNNEFWSAEGNKVCYSSEKKIVRRLPRGIYSSHLIAAVLEAG